MMEEGVGTSKPVHAVDGHSIQKTIVDAGRHETVPREVCEQEVVGRVVVAVAVHDDDQRVVRLCRADLGRIGHARHVGWEEDVGLERNLPGHHAEATRRGITASLVVDVDGPGEAHIRDHGLVVVPVAGMGELGQGAGIFDDSKPRDEITVDDVERGAVVVVRNERRRIGDVVPEVCDDVILARLRRGGPHFDLVHIDAAGLHLDFVNGGVAAEHGQMIQ